MADSNVKKTIQINPVLFSGKGGGGAREKREKKPRPTQRNNPLKKELMNRIKQHASNHNKTLKQKKDFESSFDEHMDYLSTLSKKRKVKVHSQLPSELAKPGRINFDSQEQAKRVTQAPELQASVVPSPTHTVHPNMPELAAPAPASSEPAATVSASSEPAAPVSAAPVESVSQQEPPSVTIDTPEDSIETHTPSIQAKPMDHGSTSSLFPLPTPPPYGILKQGTKPTFRQWHKKTQKARPQVAKPKEMVQQIKKTYSLGKKNNRVSVFLKNKKTRKKIQDEMSSLKRIPIDEVKSYLRKHNMIKAGSNAPHDVLRQLYQTSHLAGDITNKSNDTLIHNYLADKEDNE